MMAHRRGFGQAMRPNWAQPFSNHAAARAFQKAAQAPMLAPLAPGRAQPELLLEGARATMVAGSSRGGASTAPRRGVQLRHAVAGISL